MLRKKKACVCDCMWLVKDLIGIAWVCEHILPTYCKIKSLFKTHSHGLWLHRDAALISTVIFIKENGDICTLCEYYVMFKMGFREEKERDLWVKHET